MDKKNVNPNKPQKTPKLKTLKPAELKYVIGGDSSSPNKSWGTP